MICRASIYTNPQGGRGKSTSKTFWVGMRIVSTTLFGRIKIPKGGHRVSKKLLHSKAINREM